MKSFSIDTHKDTHFYKNLEFVYEFKDKSHINTSNQFGYNFEIDLLRDKIDTININIWKKVRWYINPYDFLVKDPIINRAFYKFWEIIKYFDFINSKTKRIASLAEAPGGFIQGFQVYYDNYNIDKSDDKADSNQNNDGWTTIVKQKKKSIPIIYTTSLNKKHDMYKEYNLPSYNKCVLSKNVRITYGADNTGDISKIENYEHFRKFSDFNMFDVITADGGFDEGNDFNHKEQLHYILFLTEIFYAISFQNQGGNFLLKTFDLFTETSIHLLWLLTNVYEDVYICKPNTSRPTNSERYIVCKNFSLDERKRQIIVDFVKSTLVKLNDIKLNNDRTNHFILFTLFKPNSLPESFIERLSFINNELLKFQCGFLKLATNLVEDTDFLTKFEDKKEELLLEREKSYNEWKDTFDLSI